MKGLGKKLKHDVSRKRKRKFVCRNRGKKYTTEVISEIRIKNRHLLEY